MHSSDWSSDGCSSDLQEKYDGNGGCFQVQCGYQDGYKCDPTKKNEIIQYGSKDPFSNTGDLVLQLYVLGGINRYGPHGYFFTIQTYDYLCECGKQFLFGRSQKSGRPMKIHPGPAQTGWLQILLSRTTI